MRPSMRTAKKKSIKTPGGRTSWHRIKDKSNVRCEVCHRPLQGSRRSRAHRNMCSPCSRKMIKLKVTEYVKKR